MPGAETPLGAACLALVILGALMAGFATGVAGFCSARTLPR
jgi:uncharacterized integral membrane protein